MPMASSVCAVQLGHGDHSARREARGFMGSQTQEQTTSADANANIGRHRGDGPQGVSNDSTSSLVRRPSSEELPKNPSPAGNSVGSSNLSSISLKRLRK